MRTSLGAPTTRHWFRRHGTITIVWGYWRTATLMTGCWWHSTSAPLKVCWAAASLLASPAPQWLSFGQCLRLQTKHYWSHYPLLNLSFHFPSSQINPDTLLHPACTGFFSSQPLSLLLWSWPDILKLPVISLFHLPPFLTFILLLSSTDLHLYRSPSSCAHHG